MTKRLLSLALVLAAIVTVHLTIVRPWFSRWGATDREMTAVWPGDELSAAADIITTRAVTIDATPERALVLATMPMGERAVKDGSTLAFLLDPVDASHTRLIMRSRGPSPSSFGWLAFDRGVFQPAHFAMERRMMLTIKALAEGSDPDEIPDLVQAGLWIAIGLSCALALAAVCFTVRWRRALFALAAGAAALAVATLTQPPVLVTALLAAGVAAINGSFPHAGALRRA